MNQLPAYFSHYLNFEALTPHGSIKRFSFKVVSYERASSLIRHFVSAGNVIISAQWRTYRCGVLISQESLNLRWFHITGLLMPYLNASNWN